MGVQGVPPLGMQKDFDWNQVGVAALSGGLLRGTSLAKIGEGAGSWNAVSQGITNSVVNQGLNILFSEQKGFSWRELAISAVSAPISAAVGANAAARTGLGFAGVFAAGLTSGYVRRGLGGRIDTAEILADAFGNALGNSIVDTMSAKPAMQMSSGSVDELQEVQITPRYIGPGADIANARLDNNPTGSVYQPAAAMTSDEQREIDALQEVQITAEHRGPDNRPIHLYENVLVTKPRWNAEQGSVYDRLAPSYGEYAAAKMIDNDYHRAKQKADLTESALGRFLVTNHVALANVLGDPLEIPVGTAKWASREALHRALRLRRMHAEGAL